MHMTMCSGAQVFVQNLLGSFGGQPIDHLNMAGFNIMVET